MLRRFLLLYLSITLSSTGAEPSLHPQSHDECVIEKTGQTVLETCFYPNGETKTVHSYTNNVRDGLWIMYNMDGTPRLILPFAMNKFDGIAKQFDDHGRLEHQEQWINDIRSGPSIDYYPSGVIKSKVKYVNGMKNGTEISYDNNGNVIEVVPYVYNQIDGIHLRYDSDGKIIYIFEYSKGEKIRGGYREKGEWIEVSRFDVWREKLSEQIVQFFFKVILILITPFLHYEEHL